MTRLIHALPRLLLALLLGSLSVTHAQEQPPAPEAACENPATLRFALIPRLDLARQLEDHRPLIQHLEQVLGRKIEVIQTSSYGAVIEGLLAGTIDLASVGPASYVLARRRDHTIIPFVTWSMRGGHFVKAGSPTYNSMLIVRKDSGIRNLADLKGLTLTLTDPASTSGAVVPRAEFSALVRTRLEDYFERITYSGSHDSSIEMVRKGYTHAAFVASEHLDTHILKGSVAPEDLRVLWQSRPIPHDPFVYRSKLCPELRDAIRQAFLSDSPQIRQMLANLKGEQFLPIDDEAFHPLHDIIGKTAP